MARITIIALMTTLAVGCSQTDFAGEAVDTQVPVNNPPPATNPLQNGQVPGGTVDNPVTGGDNNLPATEGEIAQRRTECWFAVSGTYIGGVAGYQDVFPRTTSGRPIGHGERFDNVGGVFLIERPTPYVYGQGARELDNAVDTSFDSIAVAPGMRAVIKDANGVTMLDQAGPFFVLSSDYGNHALVFEALNRIRSNAASYPAWMRDIVNSSTFPQRRPLHAGRSVLVSAIPGQRCDFGLPSASPTP